MMKTATYGGPKHMGFQSPKQACDLRGKRSDEVAMGPGLPENQTLSRRRRRPLRSNPEFTPMSLRRTGRAPLDASNATGSALTVPALRQLPTSGGKGLWPFGPFFVRNPPPLGVINWVGGLPVVIAARQGPLFWLRALHTRSEMHWTPTIWYDRRNPWPTNPQARKPTKRF